MARALILSLTTMVAAATQPVAPSSADGDLAALFNADVEDIHSTPAVWNGTSLVFVDFPVESDGMTWRQIYAVVDRASNPLRVKVASVEPEGGDADVAAIGFANADRDPAKELIVILEWPQEHYDYGGRFLEVRIFDDLKPGKSELLPLTKLSEHFGFGCECGFRDGRPDGTYAFTTISNVKAELRRLGY